MDRTPPLDLHRLDSQVRRLAGAGDHAAAVRLLEDALAHPHADDALDRGEVLEEIADLHASAGDYDAAIAAMHGSIAAGRTVQPDARHRVAEFHLRAGRVCEAIALYEELRVQFPRDVWLYNAGGFDLAEAGEHERALEWLTTGLRLAVDSGDPEELVAQLAEERVRCLQALGRLDEEAERPYDELEAEAAAFLRDRGRQARRREKARTAAESPATALALAWFPPGELTEVLRRWPHLAEGYGSDDEQHRRHLEAALRDYRDAGAPRLAVAPLDVTGLQAHAADQGLDPGTGEARAAYSAELARRGDALVWPPPRNGPCWCRSRAKYKKCCGGGSATVGRRRPGSGSAVCEAAQ